MSFFDQFRADESQKPKGNWSNSAYTTSGEGYENMLESAWREMRDRIDSIPQTSKSKSKVVFSPSSVDACCRELYYRFTNSTTDDTPAIPWKTRRAENASGAHEFAEKRYTKHQNSTDGFRIIATECWGSGSHEVKLGEQTYTVNFVGRPDILAESRVDGIPSLPIGSHVIIDFKYKDKASGVSGIRNKGVPSYNHAQMVTYSLMSYETPSGSVDDINAAILSYESMQKPKESVLESSDLEERAIFFTELDRQTVLRKLAGVVRDIENSTLPPKEPEKCMFCQFKSRCESDGDS